MSTTGTYPYRMLVHIPICEYSATPPRVPLSEPYAMWYVVVGGALSDGGQYFSVDIAKRDGVLDRYYTNQPAPRRVVELMYQLRALPGVTEVELDSNSIKLYKQVGADFTATNRQVKKIVKRHLGWWRLKAVFPKPKSRG